MCVHLPGPAGASQHDPAGHLSSGGARLSELRLPPTLYNFFFSFRFYKCFTSSSSSSILKEPIQVQLFTGDCVIFNYVQDSLNSALANVPSSRYKFNTVLKPDNTVSFRTPKKKNPLKLLYSFAGNPLIEVQE